MTALGTFHEYGRELEEQLRAKTFPVAVKLLEFSSLALSTYDFTKATIPTISPTIIKMTITIFIILSINQYYSNQFYYSIFISKKQINPAPLSKILLSIKFIILKVVLDKNRQAHYRPHPLHNDFELPITSYELRFTNHASKPQPYPILPKETSHRSDQSDRN